MRKISHILILAIFFATTALLFFSPGLASAQTQDAFGIKCWVGITSGGIDPGGCVALIGYYFFWYPTSLLLILAAALFDTIVTWSFNPGAILSGPLVSTAWGTVRDIANLALIFALLYIAIATILQIGGVQLKRAVASVIIVGLLINFSLFVTRVVIDASNILAGGLYSKITAVSSNTSALGSYNILGVDVKGISATIVSKFNPQKMLTQDVVNAWRDARDGISGVFFVFLFAAVINVVAAYIFLKAGLLLVARVVMFVFLMISSPLAFVAWALPGGGNNFASKWWGSLVNQALVAPVFFLFLYVITTVYSSSLLSNIISGSTNQGFMQFLVSIALPFIIIIVALFIALKVTTKLAGEAGSYATKIGGAVVGGAVLGGAAFAGRTVIGGAATRFAESERFKKFGDQNPTLGRWTKAGLDKVSSAGFDLRNVKGMDDLGKGKKGGYAADLKARTRAKEKFGQHLEKDQFGNERKARQAQTPIIDKETGQYAQAQHAIIDPSTGKTIMEKGEHIYSDTERKHIEQYYATPDATSRAVLAQELAEMKKKREASSVISAKAAYQQKLEKAGKKGVMGKNLIWARSSRDAAKNLRSGKTTQDNATEKLEKITKELAEGGESETLNALKEEAEKSRSGGEKATT